MPDVIMPRLSDSMEEGTIVSWRVADGDVVQVGQELAEVETDKATVGFEAEAAGTIRILIEEGKTVALGVVIAKIGEDVGGAGEEDGRRTTWREPAATAPPTAAGSGAGPAVAAAISTSGGGKRTLASPIARRVAADLGVDLAALAGSGPRGRIVRADVEQAAGRSSNGALASVGVAGRPEVTTAKGEVERLELTRVQQVVARRMAESKATVPDFAVSVEVDMEAAVALREELKRSRTEGGAVPSVNDFVVLACGRVLREFPRANASYVDGGIESFGRVNVGVAVAAEDALVVATVFDADRHTLGGIARATRALAASVRDGSVTPPELAGATFTVSNLGMFGVDHFTAIVNAPQAAILSVGAVKEKPVARDGEVVVRRCMTMTLSADHRVLYGADAAQFVGRVRALLEAPTVLLAG